MRKTKIICTIGPASENEEVLTQMCLAGMNVARLNFSHGTHEEHEKKIELIKKVRQKLDLPIAIMLDTKGPEYRIGTFENGKITIADGAEFTFTIDDVTGNESIVSVNYKNLHKDLKPGDVVTVNNGMVKFEVQEIEGSNIRCKCLIGGTLSNRKSMSFPNKVMSGPYLSEQDKADLDQIALQKLSQSLLDEINAGTHNLHSTEVTVSSMTTTDVLIVVFFPLAGVAIVAVIVILVANAMKKNKDTGSKGKSSSKTSSKPSNSKNKASDKPKASKKRIEEEDEDDDEEYKRMKRKGFE